jgi:hypothetical protein
MNVQLNQCTIFNDVCTDYRIKLFDLLPYFVNSESCINLSSI